MELRHTPRLYVEQELQQGAAITLPAEQAHYLQHVMRAKIGDVLRLFNGRQGEFRGVVATLGKKAVTLGIAEATRAMQPEPDLWLCAAPIKKAHFEYMIEKATELGVSVIQPILTARTQIRDVNLDRCRAIAIEAAEQSDRLTIPEIRKPVTLKDFAAAWAAQRHLIVCAEWGDAHPIGTALAAASPSRLREGPGEGRQPQDNGISPPSIPPASGRETLTAASHHKAAILTGPEGGLAADELEILRRLSQAICVRLGPRILRADTAAIAALTCWQAMRGDWRG